MFFSAGFKPIQSVTEDAKDTGDGKGETGKPVASSVIPGTGWHVVWTDSSKFFFFNPTSKTSIWERPVELIGNAKVDEIVTAGPNTNSNGTSLLQIELALVATVRIN